MGIGIFPSCGCKVLNDSGVLGRGTYHLKDQSIWSRKKNKAGRAESLTPGGLARYPSGLWKNRNWASLTRPPNIGSVHLPGRVGRFHAQNPPVSEKRPRGWGKNLHRRTQRGWRGRMGKEDEAQNSRPAWVSPRQGGGGVKKWRPRSLKSQKRCPEKLPPRVICWVFDFIKFILTRGSRYERASEVF